MYGNRNFQNAKMDLHGRRSDSGLDFQPKSERAYRGVTHACAGTKFQDFIMTARPADRPPMPGEWVGNLNIYFKIYQESL